MGGNDIDIALYADVLRRHRTIVLVGVVLTFCLVVLSVARVSPSGVSYRSPQVWSNQATLVLTQQGAPELRSVLPTSVTGGSSSLADTSRFAGLIDVYTTLATSDPVMTKIPNDPRVTRVGRFLRRSSIDELPQLINVIKGEMSLVGPRPLILEEDAFVQEWARKRLDIKPGITGLWQVLGRSDIPFDEMTKLDYVYVTNWSLREDIRLILLTVPALLRTRRAF